MLTYNPAERRAFRAALTSHIAAASDLVRDALGRAGLTVEPGILLEPGMFDDLAKFRTDHDLWHVVAGDTRSVAARQLVAGRPERNAER